ncbi:MAG: thioredoxin-dependent thiol peroxidase [Hyphomicrobiales bacterium]
MTKLVKHLHEGDAAPGFELPADGGNSVKLRDFEGKNLVLYFYPRDATPGCTKQAIGFSESMGDFAAANAEIVGVSADSVASHDKFKEKQSISFTLASDEETKMLQSYGVWVEKSMYGRKFMGIERTTFLIDPDGKIARIWRKVKVPGHVEDVLAAVKALD